MIPLFLGADRVGSVRSEFWCHRMVSLKDWVFHQSKTHRDQSQITFRQRIQRLARILIYAGYKKTQNYVRILEPRRQTARIVDQSGRVWSWSMYTGHDCRRGAAGVWSVHWVQVIDRRMMRRAIYHRTEQWLKTFVVFSPTENTDCMLMIATLQVHNTAGALLHLFSGVLINYHH